jgi:hypothetical protein
MNVRRWCILRDRDVITSNGKYVEWQDYLVLYDTAKKLAEALDNMPCISDGHIKVKDEVLREFNEKTLIP